MATKKKMFGPFKIEESKTEVVRVGNLELMLIRHMSNKNQIEKVRIKDLSTGSDSVIPASTLVQVAKVLTTVDERWKFVCAMHGSYATGETERQHPKCPSCFETDMSKVRNLSGGEFVQEDEDA